jgi:hypothetical protein
LSGTGSPRVPATHAGTGLGHNLYPAGGMGFLAGIFYPDGYGCGQAIPSGRVPVAISSSVSQILCDTKQLERGSLIITCLETHPLLTFSRMLINIHFF